MSLLMRKAVLLAKSEITYGVDSMPAGGANAMLAQNVSITANSQELVERNVVRPYLGTDEQVVASNHVEISFEVEWSGSGVPGTAPAFNPLLLACAMASTIDTGVSVTYDPVSAMFGSVTMVFNVDGVNHKITGARGTVSKKIDARGIPKLQFNFKGLYNTVADLSITGVNYSAFVKPVAVNKENTPTVTLFGYPLVLQSASIDVNNTVTYRNLPNSEYILMSDRAAQGSLTFEAPKVAEFDVWSAIKNATTGPLTITHGSTPGNIVQVNCPNVQITSPQLSDSDGIATLQVAIRILPTTLGNDEFSFVYR